MRGAGDMCARFFPDNPSRVFLYGNTSAQEMAANTSVRNVEEVRGHALTVDDCSQNELIFRVYQVIVPTIFAAIVFLGLLGNLLVIYVIVSRKSLQTATNLLLLNLALSDVSFLLICGSFSVVHYVLTEWPLGDALCRTAQYLLYVTCYVTVYTLIAVSAVRYVTVVYGPNARFIHSKKNILGIVCLTWITFLLAKIPIIVVHGISVDLSTGRTECIIMGKTDARRLFASFFVFGYAFPLLVITTLYLLIVRHVKKHQPQFSNGITHAQRTLLPHQPQPQQRHVTRVLVVVCATFAGCWLPLHLHLLVSYYARTPSNLVYKILLIVWHALAFANSALNPIIYHCFSQDFKNAFKRIVCRVRANEASTVPTCNTNPPRPEETAV